MRAAKQRGLRVVLIVESSPCWTSTAPEELRRDCGPTVGRYPPADYAAYGDLMAFLAVRYRDVLAGLEVWNEPDQANELYWAGPDKVARYVELLRATYPRVKAAAPTVPVLAGSFVGTNGAWLESLYKAGFKGLYDGISVHFYDLPLFGLRNTRAMQRKYGDKAPLWLLEAGWNSCKPAARGREGQPCTTRGYQATNLRQLYAQTRRTSYLKAIVIYKLRDDGDNFGIFDQSGRPKPSFAALRSSFARAQRVRRVTLRTRKQRGVVRVSVGGPEGDIYQLRVSKAGQLRYILNFRLNAANAFTASLPAQLGTSGLRLSVRSLWSAKQRASARR